MRVAVDTLQSELITSNGGVAIVVDARGVYQGIVDLETIMTAVRAMREQHSAFYLAQKTQNPDVGLR